jgi:hypothetical protein
LKDFALDQLEIVANKIDAPSSPAAPAPPRQTFVVCHGEIAAECRAHAYTVFEHCGADNGVGGADGKASGRKLCGDDNFDVLPSEGGSIPGNYCGYSWFKIACK